MQDFIYGINYWPRRKAMYWWKEFDVGEVKDEWSHIRDLGLTHIRFFLLWEDFQPKPDQIPPGSLKNLEQVLAVAAELRLKLVPTLLNGNMSGRFWLPEWAEGKNLFEDGEIVAAEKLLLTRVAEAIGRHPALYAWDIANELDQINHPRSDDRGRSWLSELTEALHEKVPNIPVTYGAHYPSLTTDNGLPLDTMGDVLDFVSIHAWSVYFPVPAEPTDTRTVLFTYELASQLAGKRAYVQEFGLPTSTSTTEDEWIDDDFLGETKRIYLASEEHQAQFIIDSIRALQSAGCPGTFLWSYADYDESIWDRPPLDTAKRERFFGIVRPDGSEKPAVTAIHKLTKPPEFSGAKESMKPKFPPVDILQYYGNPQENFTKLWQDFTAGATRY